MPAKQHHYLPQTYLRGFLCDAEKEKVFAYHRFTKKITTSKISEICSKNKLYEVIDENGNKSDEIENDFFAQKIEPIFNPLMTQVHKKSPLTNPQIADLAIYISLQLLRLPSTFKIFKQIYSSMLTERADAWFLEMLDDEKRERLVAEYAKEHPSSDLSFEKKDVMKYFDGTGIKVTPQIPHNNVVRASIELAAPLSDRILRRDWEFIFAPPGAAFITSDMPVAVIIPSGSEWERMKFGGLALPGSIVIFPLSKDICVLIQHGRYRQSFPDGTKRFVKDINNTLAGAFEHYLVSHSDRLLRKFAFT